MADELVDIFDDNYNFLGTEMKSVARKEGLWVHSFHCWIVRRAGNKDYLQFQKRGKDKKVFPNALDISAAGHLRSGEKVEEGIREIKEEIGLAVSISDLTPTGIKFDVGRVGNNIVREFCHTYLYESNYSPSDYSLAKDEVEGLVEIEIVEGLKLFSGEIEQVRAIGVELIQETGEYEPVDFMVDKTLFIPRVDNYYYKAFINGQLLLKGNKYISF